MKYLFTAFVFLLTVSFTAQETITYPYNPDVDSDTYLGITDLIELLALYGTSFETGEIMVNDMTFEAYLNELYMLLEAAALPDGTSNGQFLKWNGSEWVLVMPSVGCTDAEACNYDATANVYDEEKCIYEDACGVCDGPGEIYECGCSEIPEGDCDCDGNEVDSLNVCGGECSADDDGDGICDDGDSCIGEADECGVCNGPGAIYDCGCSGVAEDDCDCEGTPDIDLDGICDPQDDCVGIPDAAGVCNGDCTTDADGDGICDDNGNDPCEGNLDSCGVCNGPGPIYECGCSDLVESACDCAGNTPDEEGNCQDCLLDTDGDGLYDDICGPCLGETSISYNGVTYGLVEIGGRCWFKENLRTTSYRDGTEIPNIQDGNVWLNLGYSGSLSSYDNDDSNADTYGYLYNGYTTASPLDVCPQFFAVPTTEDWDALIDSVGGPELAGGALKESGTDHWNEPNTGATNSSGFTAVSAGVRIPVSANDGSMNYEGKGDLASFWTRGSYNEFTGNLNSDYISVRSIFNTGESVSMSNHDMTYGHSIRCLRETVVFGCTDENYYEYNPLATVNDGSCSVAALYGCMSDMFLEYDPLANIDDGSCSSLFGCSDDDVVSYNGYSYSIVAVGLQCWFQENLQTNAFRNGESIANIQNTEQWNTLDQNSIHAWCHYENNLSYGETYGKLYNWFSVNDNRGLCPTGWRVPTQIDWTQLVDDLGGNNIAADFLKDSIGWDGSNQSGFSALPGGVLNYNFDGLEYNTATFFSSQLSPQLNSVNPTIQTIFNDYTYLTQYSSTVGASVRCVKCGLQINDLCNGEELQNLGCTEVNACNFSLSANVNDFSCEYSSCCDLDLMDTFTVNMNDAYGDGWNGASLYFYDENGVLLAQVGANFLTGSNFQTNVCLPPGCVTIVAGGGSWDSEISFEIINQNGVIVQYGGASTYEVCFD